MRAPAARQLLIMRRKTTNPPREPLDPESWLDEHGNYMLRYALSRVREKDIAEDLVQEAFLAALESRSSFAGQSSERTWLVGILKHKIIDHFRKVSRLSKLDKRGEESLEHDELFQRTGEWVDHWDEDLGPVDWRTNPKALAEQKEFWVVFSDCLSSLSPRTANAFVLREIEQLSTEEICNIMDISATNLWVMLHRARMHLRHCIEVKWFRSHGATGKELRKAIEGG